MATFYYNQFSGENYLSQWSKHIQNKSYIEDVTKSFITSSGRQTKDFSAIVLHQTKEISDIIKSATREQVAAIQQSTNAICGTIENGFELLSDNLQEISYGIGELRSELNDMASMLDWKLSLFIEQHRITNLLLGNIAILLRIPDIQKERQYYIEQGIKFLKNAIFDSDFYEDSLNNLLKAEKIEPSDFFALHRIGLIYMYSPNHLALDKAEEYFKKAAKYAVAETNSGASVTTNFLTGDLNNKLSEQTPSNDSIRLQAAESYLFAGRSCYVQGKFKEAADYASKGFSLVPQMVEAGFTQAKALAANNNETQAAIVLEKVINTDRFYSLKTLSDLDLCTKPSIQSLLKKLQKESTERAIQLLQQCRQVQIQGSNASDYVDKIDRLVNMNTYLTSKKAIDLLEKVRNWSYCEPLVNPNQIKSFNEIISLIGKVNTLQYYKSGGSIFSMQPSFVSDFSKKITNETQWDFQPDAKTTNTKSHSGNFKVFDFLENEKKYNDSLPSVVQNLTSTVQQYIDDNNQHLVCLENLRIKADNANFASSVGSGFLGGLGGAGIGFVAGIVFALINEIGTCISTGTEKNAGKNNGVILLITMLIAGTIGAIIGYTSERKKSE